MKKLVSIEDLSGWREPTALEEESIQLFKQGTLEAKIYYTFWLIVLTIVDISIVIFVIRHIFIFLSYSNLCILHFITRYPPIISLYHILVSALFL